MDEETQKWLEQVQAWLDSNPGEAAVREWTTQFKQEGLPVHQEALRRHLASRIEKKQAPPAPAAQYAQALRKKENIPGVTEPWNQTSIANEMARIDAMPPAVKEEYLRMSTDSSPDWFTNTMNRWDGEDAAHKARTDAHLKQLSEDYERSEQKIRATYERQ